MVDVYQLMQFSLQALELGTASEQLFNEGEIETGQPHNFSGFQDMMVVTRHTQTT